MPCEPFAKPPVTPDRHAAAAELLGRCRRAGYGELLDVLADPQMFTGGGRLVTARAAAALGIGEPTLTKKLAALRAIVGD